MKIACFLSLLVQSNVRDLNKLLYALADGPGHHLPDHERCCLCLDLKGCQPSFLQRTPTTIFNISKNGFCQFCESLIIGQKSANVTKCFWGSFFLTEWDDFSLPGWWLGEEQGVMLSMS